MDDDLFDIIGTDKPVLKRCHAKLYGLICNRILVEGGFYTTVTCDQCAQQVLACDCNVVDLEGRSAASVPFGTYCIGPFKTKKTRNTCSKRISRR
jgi:hypothetical protein